LYFDPNGHARPVTSTPVASSAPPLYAVLALPFSLFGWRGLVLLNALCFAAAAVLVFREVQRCAATRTAPWVGLAAFALCGFSLEYAQGVWPHMLAVFLCVAAFVLAGRAREGGGAVAAAAAGFLSALAAGVRYQNAVFAACLGLGLLVLAPKRRRVLPAFAAGSALPLLACSWINHLRLDSWNPISKGGTYLVPAVAGSSARTLLDPLWVLWSKVVDMSAHPAFGPGLDRLNAWASRSETTGAFLSVPGVLKKSLLQSAPWMLVPLVGVVIALVLFRRRTGRASSELRAAGLVIWPMLAGFALAGFGRHDGMCFNQRYFLELVPLGAIAFALIVDELPLRWTAALGGVLLANAATAALLFLPVASTARQLVELKAPLAIALLALAAWLLWKKADRAAPLCAALGLALGWAFFVHALEDVPADHEVRELHARVARTLSPEVPQRSAVAACSNQKMGLGILQLDRDLVVVDVCVDDGQAAAPTIQALLDAGRRVLVYANGIEEPLLRSLTARFDARSHLLSLGEGWEELRVIELSRQAP
jgi:hypothetical protein